MDPRQMLYNIKKKQHDPLLNQEFKRLLQENKQLKAKIRQGNDGGENGEIERLQRKLHYFVLYIITCDKTIKDYTGLLQEITKKECLNKPFDLLDFKNMYTDRFQASVLEEPETRNDLVSKKGKRLIDYINIILGQHNKETI